MESKTMGYMDTELDNKSVVTVVGKMFVKWYQVAVMLSE